MDALGTKIDMATAGLCPSSTLHPHFIHTYGYSCEKMGVGDGFSP